MPLTKEQDDNFNYIKASVIITRKLLEKNREWENRFNEYAKRILANTANIKHKKKLFHEWAPLHLYLNVDQSRKASSSVKFCLRYHGQAVADLSVSDTVALSTETYNDKNARYFGCNHKVTDTWDSPAAVKFRSFFSSLPHRIGNKEHRVESMLLTELSKGKSISKAEALQWIQPVKIADIARFQMPTPIKASSNPICYSRKGGGIDILARVGSGPNTNLCVMEVKDEYAASEPPKEALAQGVAYATFLRELLRSNSGPLWWKIFGFSRKLPKSLKIHVASVMPPNPNGSSDTTTYQDILIDSDQLKLGYIYFTESNNTIAAQRFM